MPPPPSKKPAPPAKAPAARPAVRASRGATPPADWRTDTLDRVRGLILDADPAIVEERKWIKPRNPAGVPTWSNAGIVCTGETYKAVVKLTFARGAALPDPQRLFNASLDGNARRAIDLREGDVIDPAAFQALVRAAVSLNRQAIEAKPPKKKKTAGGDG